VAPELEGEVRRLEQLPASGCAAIIFHASIGEPEVTEVLLGRSEPLVVVYHNITPAEYFEAVEPGFAGLLRSGRQELAQLRGRASLALGVSEYNADELRELGFDPVGVAPLVVAHGGGAVEPDPGVLERLAEAGGPQFLFVGQLMPHKRPDFLVQAFHILRTYLDPRAGLVLAGPARNDRYAAAVRQYVAELALPDVWLTGAVSDEQLAALYQGATAFVTATEHEGYCAPLVEAMRCGLPIVARRFAAVPGTLGTAGLLLEAEDGPTVFAEAMYAVATDDGARSRLVTAGRARAQAIDAVDPVSAFMAALQVTVD